MTLKPCNTSRRKLTKSSLSGWSPQSTYTLHCYYNLLTVRLSDFHLLLGPGIANVTGGQHRRQRKLLNPVFSVAHLRDMTNIFYKVAHRVRFCVILHWDGCLLRTQSLSSTQPSASAFLLTAARRRWILTVGWRGRPLRCSDKPASATPLTASSRTLQTSLLKQSSCFCRSF